MGQRKDVLEEYYTLKQYIFFSNMWKLAEEGEAQDYVPNPSQWHFTEEKKKSYLWISTAMLCSAWVF